MSKYKYYIFNKPYNVLSQFTKELPQHVTLKDYINVESDVYPIGRLDRDSEGLLLLTNDNKLKTKLLDPKSKSSKTYLVQVEGNVTQTAVDKLKEGVNIKLKKGQYKTFPCKAHLAANINIEPRNPPIRERKNIPTTWIEITITEGKNRQVRKMCAAVGHPCLRLIRTKIKDLNFTQLSQGKYRILDPKELAILNS